MNQVILTGRLTRDPEMRVTTSGKNVASFTLAVDRRMSRRAQEQNPNLPTADFIPCVAWEHQAEFVQKYFHKGSPMLVEGRMQVRSYEAKDGSGRRYVTEVIVNNIEFTGSRRDNEGGYDGGQQGGGFGGNGGGYQQSSAAPAGGQQGGGFGQPLADEDIPF